MSQSEAMADRQPFQLVQPHLFSRRNAAVILSALIVLIIAVFLAINFRNTTLEKRAKETFASGATSFKKGDFDKALTPLEESVKLDPKNAAAHLLLAQTHEAKGTLDKAAAEYRKAIELDTTDFQAHYNLAIIYKTQGKQTEAVKELEASVKANKSFAAALLELARLYQDTGQKDKAIKTYQTLIKMNPFGIDIEQLQQELSGLEK